MLICYGSIRGRAGKVAPGDPLSLATIWLLGTLSTCGLGNSLSLATILQLRKLFHWHCLTIARMSMSSLCIDTFSNDPVRFSV